MNYAKELNSVQKDTFPGDSGGGLMSRNGDGIWFLLGIVSTGNICLSIIYLSIYLSIQISGSYWALYQRTDNFYIYLVVYMKHVT